MTYISSTDFLNQQQIPRNIISAWKLSRLATQICNDKNIEIKEELSPYNKSNKEIYRKCFPKNILNKILKQLKV